MKGEILRKMMLSVKNHDRPLHCGSHDRDPLRRGFTPSQLWYSSGGSRTKGRLLGRNIYSCGNFRGKTFSQIRKSYDVSRVSSVIACIGNPYFKFCNAYAGVYHRQGGMSNLYLTKLKEVC